MMRDKSSKRSRMFHLDGKERIPTWNPVVGCSYMCKYCWARGLVKLYFRCPMCREFVPHFHEEKLSTKFKIGKIYFAVAWGDLFCDGVRDGWRKIIFEKIRRNRYTTFLLETKNPYGYHIYIDYIPSNVILSSTIETNKVELEKSYTKAPDVETRYIYMKKLSGFKKHISIEPILEFDLNIMFKWITDINPFIVSIGYDNYGYKLLEPPLEKTRRLGELLEEVGIKVEWKTLRKAWNEK